MRCDSRAALHKRDNLNCSVFWLLFVFSLVKTFKKPQKNRKLLISNPCFVCWLENEREKGRESKFLLVNLYSSNFLSVVFMSPAGAVQF